MGNGYKRTQKNESFLCYNNIGDSMRMIKFETIRCIVLDIDKTLTNNDREISEYTRNILKETTDRGIYVILCSGRTNQYTIEKSKFCHASSLVISDNGAIIYDYHLHKLYDSYPFSKDTIQKILGICKENHVDCILNTIHARYRLESFPQNNYIKNIRLIQNMNDVSEEVTQLVINCGSKENMIFCSKLLSEMKDVEIANTNLYAKKEKDYYFCDINIEGVSKGSSVRRLMDILSIKMDEVMCIGDSMNDYSMLQVCENFIAMKNADKKLMRKASMITEYDNNEDGAAKFISKHILNR